MNILYFRKALIVALVFFINMLILSDERALDENQLDLVKKALSDFNRAPNFTLNSIDDSLLTLDKMRGKVVLLNFWATWCGPCRMEIPDFNELHKKYNEEGLEIWGISVSDSKKQLKNFVKSYQVDYTLLWGDISTMNKITQSYGGVYALPSSFLIGKKGDILWSHPGAILKDYDPQLFAQFVYKIDNALKQEE